MVAWPQRGSPTGRLRSLTPTPPVDEVANEVADDDHELAPTLPHLPGLPRRLSSSPPSSPSRRHAPVAGQQAQVLADFAAFMLCRHPEQLLPVERIPPHELAIIYRLLRRVYEPALALAGRASGVGA